MQTIEMYLRATSAKAVLVDSWNQTLSTIPAVTRGMQARLVLHLLDASGAPLPGLESYPSWTFSMADDWDTSTTPQVRVITGIEVVDGAVVVPLLDLSTEELIAALGRSESVKLGCELAGYEGAAATPGFLLQFDLYVRNRRDAPTGEEPTPVTSEWYTAAQVNSLFAAGFSLQYSIDGATWISYATGTLPPAEARFYRFRNTAVGGDWSPALRFAEGPRGPGATVAIGTVVKGDVPSVVNSGTPVDAVLDFVLPCGDPGPQGEQGVQGPQGETGRTGANGISVTHSWSGTVLTLTSASGTTATDLQGPQGEQGVQGETGPQGESGEPGENGSSSYVYIAFAQDALGTGFSLAPDTDRPYRAEFVSDAYLPMPTLADFVAAGAVWIPYVGSTVVQGAVSVTDGTTTVRNITGIVISGATVTRTSEGVATITIASSSNGSSDFNFDF